MAPNASELAAMSRLFSSAVFREMAKNGRSALFSRLWQQIPLATCHGSQMTVGEAFDFAFGVLQVTGLRHEYIYRAALTRKILTGKHSLKTATMLNEFRAGACKADLVILNDTATVYEIKSERDSLTRLANQVENYKKVFACVNVIASEAHIEGVLATVPVDVGVMHLGKRFRISVVRDAHDDPWRICPATVFESLRSAEAASILKALGHPVPDVPNTQRHTAMRACFAKLSPEDVHRQMVRTLKRTRNLAPLRELVDRLPSSLHAAALSIPIPRTSYDRLVQAVSTPLGPAMAWD